MTTEGVKLKGIVNYRAIDKDGNLKFDTTEENLIVNTGLAEVTNLLGNVSTPVAFTFLANGSSTTAASATQTALVAENSATGSARAAATVTRQTTTVANDTLQLVKAWSITGNITVNEVGVFNNATTGTMLCRQVTSATKNLVNGDTFTVTYKIIVA